MWIRQQANRHPRRNKRALYHLANPRNDMKPLGGILTICGAVIWREGAYNAHFSIMENDTVPETLQCRECRLFQGG